ncbi:MAG: DUF167 domain-containing protein [Planctomycetes bacterium]|nr:DUF167 domain-containing protein [Planctomycetota bacterium]
MRIAAAAGGVEFFVRAKPRSAHDRVHSEADDALVVQTTAPPVDGEANDRIVRIVAAFLDVPRSRVAIASGATSKLKKVHVTGIDVASARAAVAALRSA